MVLKINLMKNFSFLLSLLTVVSLTVSSQNLCEFDGEKAINSGSGAQDNAVQLIEQPNGKILAVGTSYYSGSNHFEATLLLMNSDYSLDTTFGENGVVSYTWDSRNTANAAALQDDGKILIGGYQASGNGVGSFRAYIARLNADGSIDVSFGDNGSKKIELANNVLKGTVYGIQVLTDQKIRAAIVSAESGLGFVQLDQNGNYDTSFSQDGIALFSAPNNWAADVHYLEDGSTVFTSSNYIDSQFKVCLIKFDENGVLDNNFGENGVKTLGEEIDIVSAYSSTNARTQSNLTADEDILLVVKTASDLNWALLKINGATGEVVQNFGDNGIVVYPQSSSINTFDVITDNSTDNIYILGSQNNYPTVWKLDNSGNSMSVCDTNAGYAFPFSYGSSFKTALIHTSGKIILLGETGESDEQDSSENQRTNLMLPVVLNPTSISELSSDKFSIYPNPALDQLHLSTKSHIAKRYRILDILGRPIKEGFNASTISLQDISDGIYIIQLWGNDDLLEHFKFEKITSYSY